MFKPSCRGSLHSEVILKSRKGLSQGDLRQRGEGWGLLRVCSYFFMGPSQ